MDYMALMEKYSEAREEAPEESEATFLDDDAPEQSPPREIVAYNELRSCADIVKMHRKGTLNADPEFQREFVWDYPMQTRFVDSLLKGVPVPSMCIALDRRSNHRIVIDGLQRISTIIRFFDPGEKPWRLSKLNDVDPRISGRTPRQIREENPACIDAMEEHVLPITVLNCNLTDKAHLNYVFHIFHRLNTGGVKLKNQEIRNCIFGGSLNRLLRKLDLVPEWRRINRMKPDNNYRLVKQELILRFFAFLFQERDYRGEWRVF